jgi:hypothetical protein
MTPYVVVVTESGYPREVIGPMTKEHAEKMALGYGMSSGGSGKSASYMEMVKP